MSSKVESDRLLRLSVSVFKPGWEVELLAEGLSCLGSTFTLNCGREGNTLIVVSVATFDLFDKPNTLAL